MKPLFKVSSERHHITPWIVENLPPDISLSEYCEPCFTNGTVFFNKCLSAFEVINISEEFVNIFKALRDDSKQFIQKVKAFKANEDFFDKFIKKSCNDYFEQGVHDFIINHWGRKGKFGGVESKWKAVLSQLPEVAERLKSVSVISKNFLEVCKLWNDDHVFMYIDPPYVTLGEVKEDELSVDEHTNFLNFIVDAKANVMICGFGTTLYKKHLSEWRCLKVKVPKATHKQRQAICLWMNY